MKTTLPLRTFLGVCITALLCFASVPAAAAARPVKRDPAPYAAPGP